LDERNSMSNESRNKEGSVTKMSTSHKLLRPITTRWRWSFRIATLMLVMGWAATSRAAVTTVAFYKLGDADPGAAANTLGQNPTVDSSGNGFNLSRSGSPTNRADVANESMILGSTLSMQFNGSSRYSTNFSVTALTTNVGMEF